MRCLLVFCAIFLFALSPAFSQSGSARFVAVESLEVKSSTWFFASAVGSLRLGDEVTLVRESGRWSEIRAGGIAGWVVSASLSPRRPVRALAPVTPGEVALAGKGFGQEVEAQYRLTGPDYSLVDEMEAFAISMEELLRFILEGRLSGAEQ